MDFKVDRELPEYPEANYTMTTVDVHYIVVGGGIIVCGRISIGPCKSRCMRAMVWKSNVTDILIPRNTE